MRKLGNLHLNLPTREELGLVWWMGLMILIVCGIMLVALSSLA